ncbi:MAG: ATP-binding cassette domain-containing protein [Verrucomicrobiales bacterium]
MIEFTNVTKSFPGIDRPAVDDVSFFIEAGETVVLLGSSGCGKSTTLRLINRILDPDAGEILVRGKPNTERPLLQLRRSIGYVIQNVGLFPHWTIEENVAAPLRISGVSPAERRTRSRRLLELVELDPEEFAGRYPDELSGGQQQRVGVARALVGDPDILLMDEPFGALDGVTRESLQQETRRLNEELGKTILLVTHDLFEALALGDRIGVMHEGRLEQVGTKSDLLNHPATPFVRELFGKPARQLELYRESRS